MSRSATIPRQTQTPPTPARPSPATPPGAPAISPATGSPATAGDGQAGSATPAITISGALEPGTYLLIKVPADSLNLPPNAPLPQALGTFSGLLQTVVDELTPATPPPPPPPPAP
jgi:hypothetical protein